MRALLLLVLLIACCSVPAFCSASTLPPSDGSGSVASASSQGSGFDAFVGQGDLITRAVPVCCCSSSFACDTDPPPPPGTPCKPGTPVCKCSGFTACVNMG
jgi:hypothetical protein